jgi:glyoxylase-like metal-dependent hydrolase (beta-lactamase superfamily II)
MIHRALAVGPLRCNCHVLADPKSRDAVVVDPGDDAERILDAVRKEKLRVRHLLHTHCHFDHMTASRRLHEETGAEILIHAADKELYDRLAWQWRSFMGVAVGKEQDPLPVARFLEDRQKLRLGELEIEVLHTPGHTHGSCCFLAEGELFAGDTLFCRGVGRTDLPGSGTASELAESIRTRLYRLAPETVVHPGHGPDTTIAEERAENPFVAG